MGTAVTKLVREKKIGRYEDAKKPIYITVTEIDVERAQRIAPDSCAMAKATCRSVPNALKAFFYEYGAYVALFNLKTKKHKTLRYIPSPEARKAIATFDMTGKFPPGRYRLDAPKGSNTLCAVRGRSKRRPGRHKEGAGVIKRNVAVTTSTQGRTSSTRGIRDTKRGRLEYAFAY
jgi:hypothetical protein